MTMEKIRRYKKDSSYSYTLGAQPTVELILRKPEHLETVYFHSGYRPAGRDLRELCEERGAPYSQDDRIFARLSDKENVYVLGVFRKYKCELSADRPHILLCNPSDSGNLGTIIRTMAAFDYDSLAIITPSSDVFDPKVVRSSMGALFSVNFKCFASVHEYMEAFPGHGLISLMLGGTEDLDAARAAAPFCLAFGNEATGLPEEFLRLGRSVRIKQSALVDSLNLAVAFGIAANHFR
jgi:TrmH family RNA methyltransferase